MRRAIPIRLCIGCGNRERKSALLRFSLGPDGSLRYGCGNGRGGYLHPRHDCLRAFAMARSGVVRSLRANLSREMRIRYAAQIEQQITQWSEK